MDLNELLESMDQEPEEPGGQEEERMPELSEKEIFGEAIAESDDTDTGESEVVSGTVPEMAAEDAGPEKPKHTSRRKKAEDQTADGQPEEHMPAEGGEGQTSEDISEEMLAEASESMETDSGEEAGETAGKQFRTARRKIRQKWRTFLKDRGLQLHPAARPGQERQRRLC